MFTSNRFYNDGLEKAMVRDLSGAIVSLRQSLKLNKNNILKKKINVQLYPGGQWEGKREEGWQMALACLPPLFSQL